ncbi:MAG: hypothetical protein QFF03_11735 [Pseudomonadota bacterium]|nr:hypothetical protein [Pseudomonadota bacterium]
MTRLSVTLAFFVILAGGIVPALAPSARAAEQRIQCPRELPASALRFAETPAGWTGFIPYRFPLNSAQFMSGPPSDMAISMGEEVKLDKHRRQVRYAGLNEGIQYKGGKWMACFYGGGNDAILSRRLADDTSECVVTYTSYTRNRLDGTNIDIRCK